MFKAKMLRLAAIPAAVLSSVGSAFAQTASTTFDASTYASNVTGTIPGLLAIGAATFAVVLAIKSTKWGKRAL